MFLPAHYVCDVCQRLLESEDERYVLRMEACDETSDGRAVDCKIDSDRDYLQEIDDLLERGGDLEDSQSLDEVDSPIEYHLCHECRQKFLLDPLGRHKRQQLDFSNN
jgi:hypothetical protein